MALMMSYWWTKVTVNEHQSSFAGTVLRSYIEQMGTQER